MNPYNIKTYLKYFCQPQILVKNLFSPHIIPKSTYTCMRLTTSDGRFAMANFFATFPIFCGHSSKFTCHPIFSLPDRKNRCRKSDIGCRKSESDTYKQPNINEKKGKDRCRKSAIGCRKPHTCVRTLRQKDLRKVYKGSVTSDKITSYAG